MATKNIMIVGVGGQGSLLASKLLGRLLVDEGYDVKVSEVRKDRYFQISTPTISTELKCRCIISSNIYRWLFCF